MCDYADEWLLWHSALWLKSEEDEEESKRKRRKRRRTRRREPQEMKNRNQSKTLMCRPILSRMEVEKEITEIMFSIRHPQLSAIPTLVLAPSLIAHLRKKVPEGKETLLP
jgi:hypothetical protein